MSEGKLVVVWLLSCGVAWIFLISVSIRAVRRKVLRWDRNSTIWFIVTLGNCFVGQVERWKNLAGYDEAQARIIIRHQIWCLLGLFLAFGASAAATIEYQI